MNSCITGCLINIKSRLDSVHLLKSLFIPLVIVQAPKGIVSIHQTQNET